GVTAPTNFIGATWKAVHGTLFFTGCTSASVPSPTHCTYDLTAMTQPSAGVTRSIVDMTCSVYQASTKVCDITGQVHGTYTNPTGAVAGKLTLLAPGTMRTGAGCAAFLGGSNEPMVWSHQTFTVTGGSPTTLGPIITRTA